MDTELLRLAKAVTDHMEIELRTRPLKGEFAQTTLHAYLRMGNTTYGYDSEVGGEAVLKAMVKLKQYIEALERDTTATRTPHAGEA